MADKTIVDVLEEINTSLKTLSDCFSTMTQLSKSSMSVQTEEQRKEESEIYEKELKLRRLNVERNLANIESEAE